MNNLFFFGSDQYSSVALKAIIESQIYKKITVVTDRPKPVKNNLSPVSSNVEKLAKTHELKILYYPANDVEMINFIALLKDLHNSKLAVGLCASFDHLLPKEIIDIFTPHLYNLHPSLLPQYRNVSPVQYALALGDKTTGITLFRITTGIDNGEIISQAQETIEPSDTTGSLTPRLFLLGANLFLKSTESNFAPASPSPKPSPLIFTKRLTRESGYIEWSVLEPLLSDKTVQPSASSNPLLNLRLTHNPSGSRLILHDLTRALSPWPSVWSLVPTKKGEQRIVVEAVIPEIQVKIAGKPNAISYTDFKNYYL